MYYLSYQGEIEKTLSNLQIPQKIKLLEPPSPELGDFCIVVNSISGREDPKTFGANLRKSLASIDNVSEISLYDTATSSKKKGIVYLNFTIESEYKKLLQSQFIQHVLNHVFSDEFGFPNDQKDKKAIVEHTSANPISPLHVGNLRNSVLGDTFSRILKRMGFQVFRHFYVNDVGLQVSFVVIGYEILKESKVNPDVKFDLWLGKVYAIMYNFYSIQVLKSEYDVLKISKSRYELSKKDQKTIISVLDKEYNRLKDQSLNADKKLERKLKRDLKRIEAKISDIKKLRITQIDLKDRFPVIHTTILKDLKSKNLIDLTGKYLHSYEHSTDEQIFKLFREVVDWVLDGFKWTLDRYNIQFDKFDYESDVSVSGLPSKLIEELKKSDSASTTEGEAVRFSYPKEKISALISELKLEKSEIPVKGNIPDLQLRRSDGTALYAAKDIAYSIVKYDQHQPHFVFNVISSEQSLPQYQLLLPLIELGKTEVAKTQKHFAYENVDLRGRRMSGRLAMYVTADEYYDETIIRARIAKRTSDAARNIKTPDTKEEWDVENESLKSVALASTRFPLIETSPQRKIELDLDRELDFKRNSGPFIQYAHARANGVARKYGEFDHSKHLSKSFEAICTTDNVKLLTHLLDFNNRIKSAYSLRDPSQIASWLFELARLFMKFYENNPILKAEDNNIASLRLLVLIATRLGLKNGLVILGINPADTL